ncbi:MAG: protein YgfX [Methylococcales bacterium]
MVYVKKYEPALAITLKPSRRLKQLLIFIHVLALIASIANGLPIWAKLFVFLAVAGHYVWLTKRSGQPQYRIQHSHESGWQIFNTEQAHTVQILASTVITTFLIFLHYTANGKPKTLLVANDALSTDDYRQLIVRLKTTVNDKLIDA